MSGAALRTGGVPSPAAVAALRARLPAAFGPTARARQLRWAAALAAGGWFAVLLWWFGFSPARLWNGVAGLARIVVLMVPPSWGEQGADIATGLAQSVAMALLGTAIAVAIAFPLGFLGARHVVLRGLAHFGLRRVFDAGRAVDQLIWALVFVRAVGLGPLAGVLAIAAAEVGVLAKIFAEAIENADRRQTETITAVGGGALARIRFGLIPQVLPVLVAQALYQFESNTRSASVLGVVGAGGIGLQISERIKVRYWDEVAFIILALMVIVAVIDALSARLRRRLVG